MAYNGFAIDTYLDAEAVNQELDALIQKPVYTIRREKLKDYVQNYFEQKCSQSKAMIAQAKKVIPGGVQHNLAFNYPFPIVITKAEGAKLYDLDGNWYYDLLQAGGPTILGSNMLTVREPVMELLKTCGPSTGLFHEFEYKLAKKISDLVPSVEMFRMLGSGTEACMVAVRIARLKTGHKNILKMGGAYHGWSDQLAYGIRIPGTKGILSKGVPGFVFKHTDEFFPGDLEDLERKLKANRLNGGTAAVFLEPVGPESGTWPVSKEFIRGAVELAHRYGAPAVFDEVVTGFRMGLSGAQGYFGVDPDLTIFGKIIAGGYPGAGGIGGHASCMAHLGQGGSIPCAAYGLPSTDLLRRAVKAQWLAHPESRVMLLKSHGALCLGESMEEAFQNAQALEDYCAGVVAPYLDGVEKIAVSKDLGRSIRCGSRYELDLGWTKKTCWVGDFMAKGAAAFHSAIYRLTSARAVLHCTDPYVVELSQRGENLRAMLDDLAQIAGSEILSLPPKPRRVAAALIPANAVLVMGFGALCTGNTLEDAETVEKLLVKGCRAWRFALSHPTAAPLSQGDAFLQRTLYVTKYAKRKK